jgi:hypothetical protein
MQSAQAIADKTYAVLSPLLHLSLKTSTWCRQQSAHSKKNSKMLDLAFAPQPCMQPRISETTEPTQSQEKSPGSLIRVCRVILPLVNTNCFRPGPHTRLLGTCYPGRCVATPVYSRVLPLWSRARVQHSATADSRRLAANRVVCFRSLKEEQSRAAHLTNV